MINTKNTKLIRIPSRGKVITSRGFVNTPITKPYRETLPNIFRMLTSKPKPTILEVLPNGRTVELTISNFDKDNTLIKPNITTGPVIPSVNNAEIINPEDKVPEDTKEGTPEVTTPVEDEVKEDATAQVENTEQGEEASNNTTTFTPDKVAVDTGSEVQTDEAANETGSTEVPEATTPVEDEVKEDATAQVENTNNNQQSRNNKNRNKNKNKNNRQQTSETAATENVEVVPEEVQ